MTKLRRTPIYPAYAKQAKFISFAGWEMPVQFSRIQEEHEAVRQRAGMFDVSHMGEIEIRGPAAKEWLQKMTTNDLSKLAIHQVQYTTLCRPDGGTIDDLLIYRLEETVYLLVVNAGNVNKDFNWLQQHRIDQVEIRNRSEELALIAIQGPQAESILQPVLDMDLTQLKPFTFQQAVPLWDVPILLSRTGYTGEDGFELYLPSSSAVTIWEKLLELGQADGLVPCGLGARDTLRFEAGLPLYGQELTEEITPIEAGIGFAVKPEKGSFLGQEVLRQQKIEGAPRTLIGLEMVERGIPRTGYPVFVKGEQIGEVTTGTRSPTLKKDIALALIDAQFQDQVEVEVEIRGKRRQAKQVPIPFYRRG